MLLGRQDHKDRQDRQDHKGRHEDRPQAPDYYQAYLVRMWKDGKVALWRASAQSAQSGEVARFGSLEALFAFPESQTADGADNKGA